MADMNYYLEMVLNKRGVYKIWGEKAKTAAFHQNQPQNNPDCVQKKYKKRYGYRFCGAQTRLSKDDFRTRY